MKAVFSEYVQFSPCVCLSHRVTPIDPFFGHIADSAHLYRCTFSAGGHRLVWSQDPLRFPLFVLTLSPTFGLCTTGCYRSRSLSLLSSAVWHLFLLMQSALPDHSEAVLSHTEPRLPSEFVLTSRVTVGVNNRHVPHFCTLLPRRTRIRAQAYFIVFNTANRPGVTCPIHRRPHALGWCHIHKNVGATTKGRCRPCGWVHNKGSAGRKQGQGVWLPLLRRSTRFASKIVSEGRNSARDGGKKKQLGAEKIVDKIHNVSKWHANREYCEEGIRIMRERSGEEKMTCTI